MIRPLLLLLLLSALGVAACGGRPAAVSDGAGREAAVPAYAAPPVVSSVDLGPGGGIRVAGTAEPDARVRLTAYGGEAYGAQADARGAFRLDLPPAAGPRLVALSVQSGDREVEGDGWLFAPSDRPDRAVILRPGAPATPVSGGTALALVAVDYDAGGGAAVSGFAPASARVAVLIDAVPAGQATAAPDGRFAARIGPRVAAGTRQVLIAAAGERRAYAVAFRAPPPAGALSVARSAEGWRVEWPTSGGGAQATLVLTGGPGA